MMEGHNVTEGQTKVVQNLSIAIGNLRTENMVLRADLARIGNDLERSRSDNVTIRYKLDAIVEAMTCKVHPFIEGPEFEQVCMVCYNLRRANDPR